ncbi:MAG: hypothetical protein LCH89_21150 [Proteobacteria bacterium]|nr:hypothetical protein [Pseudomonadota bacterium]
MRALDLPVLLALLGALVGCASTSVQTQDSQPAARICQTERQPLSALILWAPDWRADQKDVAAREAAAQQGLAAFARQPRCYSRVRVERLPTATPLTDEQLRTRGASAADRPDRPDRIVLLTLHELGPVLQVLGAGGPVSGGTEVVLRTRVHDAASGALLAERRTHWRDGGAFVVKGVATLPQDLRAALDAALSDASAAP